MGGFQTGGFPDLDLSSLFVLFLSLLGVSRFFCDFPDLSGGSSGIFPICPFPLRWRINSACEEQSQKGLRHNLDLSRKSGKPPGLEPPRFSLSPKSVQKQPEIITSHDVLEPLKKALLRINQQDAPITSCDLFRPKSVQKQPDMITSHDVLEPLFSRVLFPFLPPLLVTPLPPPGTLFTLFSPQKLLCSVEQGAQHRAWTGAVSGSTSAQISGRKFLPEICVKKGLSLKSALLRIT